MTRKLDSAGSSSKHSRRDFLRHGALAAAGIVGGGSSSASAAELTEPTGSSWERPPQQRGNNLNLIVLVSDTFRRDNLACYGSQWVECPNLNRFAQDCVILDDFYPEGMPTIVIRRTLYTGRRVIPCYYFPQHEPVQLPGWHPLYYEDVTLAETLLMSGYLTALVADLPHFFRPGRNFQRGFNVFRWIRGQEADSYGTSPHRLLDVSDLVSEAYLARFPGLHGFLSQYKANRDRWKKRGESLVQLVAQEAIDWLKENRSERPFYLQVEAFDPHEPWDPPARFLKKYLPHAKGPSFVEPPYATVPLPEDIRKRFRANYAGEASCVDFWFGKVLDTIRESGLFENSVVVFLADHGAMLGEQGQFVKGPDKLRGQVTHIPMLVRLPGRQFAGKRVSGFVQMPDVMPTLLHLLGLKPPRRVTGQNFWPLVAGTGQSLREFVMQTYGWVGAVRTREWNYSQVWKPEAQHGPYRPQLYQLERDPEELHDVAERYPDVTGRLAKLMRDYVASGEGLTLGSFNAKFEWSEGRGYINRPD
ncbi:MAG: sulfatase [Verrucomicrobia bacterium]|nr:sulfatase [Verrucomicrobiota bacterium]